MARFGCWVSGVETFDSQSERRKREKERVGWGHGRAPLRPRAGWLEPWMARGQAGARTVVVVVVVVVPRGHGWPRREVENGSVATRWSVATFAAGAASCPREGLGLWDGLTDAAAKVERHGWRPFAHAPTSESPERHRAWMRGCFLGAMDGANRGSK